MRLSRQLQVFLLYARSDKESIHRLYDRLVKDGVRVWLDEEKILPGQDWEYEIRKAMLRSDIVVVCLSRQFNRQGGYRHEELRIALEKANSLPESVIFLVPARLEMCGTTESLSRWQRVELFEADGYQKLMSLLKKYIMLT